MALQKNRYFRAVTTDTPWVCTRGRGWELEDSTTLVMTSRQLRHWGEGHSRQACTHKHTHSNTATTLVPSTRTHRPSHTRATHPCRGQSTCNLRVLLPSKRTCKVEAVAALLGGRVARVHCAEVAVVTVTRRAAPVHLQQQVGGPRCAADLAHRGIQLQEEQHRRWRQTVVILLQPHMHTCTTTTATTTHTAGQAGPPHMSWSTTTTPTTSPSSSQQHTAHTP